MSDKPDFDDEEDEDWGAVEDFDDTGKGPRFFKMERPSPADLTAMKVDDLVKEYRDIRDQLGTDRKGYKAREALMKEQLTIISMILRDKADAIGVNSFATSHGTAFRNLKEKFRVADWQALCDYVARTGNFQVLQKRTSPNAVKEIRETDGEIPPGIDYIPEVEFSVRSPTARTKK